MRWPCSHWSQRGSHRKQRQWASGEEYQYRSRTWLLFVEKMLEKRIPETACVANL